MLEELVSALDATTPGSQRNDYIRAIVDENCLAKPTHATRKSSLQRLSELYAFDPSVPVFRMLRSLWDIDPASRPLIALLAAIARDPLLMATAKAILPLQDGAEFQRSLMKAALKDLTGERMNESTLDKVVRNAASTWTQTGHLKGRTLKVRHIIQPTPTAVAYALWLGREAGFDGAQLLETGWVAVLDCSPIAAKAYAIEAKRVGLIDLATTGDIFDISFDRMDPRTKKGTK